MGMSNDFEVAIEEGATIVRVGTAILVEDVTWAVELSIGPAPLLGVQFESSTLRLYPWRRLYFFLKIGRLEN